MSVIISNGSNKFHLAPLAAEIARRGQLDCVIASGWPTRVTRSLAAPFTAIAAVRRFLDRGEEIPINLQRIITGSEILFQAGIRLRRISERVEQKFDLPAFWWYANFAKNVIRSSQAKVYHYRACYGLHSVPFATRKGIRALCDHSIAHPGVLQYMVENEGKWPGAPIPYSKLRSPLQRLMYRDISHADAVLVNSDFVKKTCVFSGVPHDRIHVVYLGVDDKFFYGIPKFDEAQIRQRNRKEILFAGGIQKRKGITTLAKASEMILGVSFKLVGGTEHGLERENDINRWFSSGAVARAGVVSRVQLAKHMVDAGVFVFPSYCEGSARVIFEAMACGCYIITTDNSGSIVQNGIHGAVVPPGDAAALATAVNYAIAHPEDVARIGWQNALLVRARYRQSHYADNVMSVYNSIY